MTRFVAYRRRRFAQVAPWHIGATIFRTYTISVNDAALPAALLEAARDYVAAHSDVINAGEHGHGCGYAMVHHGEQAIWLLAHWWAYGDIAMRLLASADSAAAPAFVPREDDRFHACVWEHVVINHERNAWVRHVLTPAPSIDAYLDDGLPDGWY